MAEPGPQSEQMVLTHFIVSNDIERSRRLVHRGPRRRGGLLRPAVKPTNIALANSWIVISVGGGRLDDKPGVTLETPPDPGRVSSFLNIRVKDIEAAYAEWSARGARFPDATQATSVRDPVLHPRSRRPSDRGRANHQPRGLDPPSVAAERRGGA